MSDARDHDGHGHPHDHGHGHHDHGHGHPHDHGHGHHDHGHGHGHHHDVSHVSDARLLWAVVLNVGLTVVQVGVGVFAGSLALLADALHNFGDAGALVIAWVARRIARRGADSRFTFGYRRAELVGALVNVTTLIVVGLYLAGEAVARLLDPQPVLAGWVMATAGVALVVDLATAAALWGMSHGNLNVRAAFVHNLTDAAASLAVLAGAGAIALWDIVWLDAALTLLLAAAVLWSSIHMLRRTAGILMQGTPPRIDLAALEAAIAGRPGVAGVHHLHVWELDEAHVALEVHVVVDGDLRVSETSPLRREIHTFLRETYGISHATLELECPAASCEHPADGVECRASPSA